MVRIHQLTAAEGPRLRAIRLRALDEAPDAFGSTFDEAVARPLESWTRDLLSMAAFVSARDQSDVGLVRCARDERDPRAAWLISMWVAPEARRAGVGGLLIDAVIAWARANGMHRLLLDVADHNAPAIALYAHKGFEPTGGVGSLPPPREYIREHERELRLSGRG